MRLYVGITDSGWYQQLASLNPDEVNFWKPGGRSRFNLLQPGELFLFKLHSPLNFIVGGGYFLRFSTLPVSMAWAAFEDKNGVKDLREFQTRIRKYRSGPVEPDPTIGCVILTEPFFFEREQWIPAPPDWPMSTMEGKTYDALESTGHSLRMQVQERIGTPLLDAAVAEERVQYGREYTTQSRLGQGAFRVLVTEAYDRRCAITGEKTLPVLEAAHIKPVTEDGPHAVSNGLLLRADMHILFDAGYLTVTPEYRIEVSSKIEEQYTNGKLYYSYRGQELRTMPSIGREQPRSDFLKWHNEQVFVP